MFGRTVGLIGLGFIARHVAKICTGMGMRVLAYDPYQTDEMFSSCGAERCANPLDMLPQCDFVSVHLNVTDETRGMINANWFDHMREDAYFINTARAAVVDQKSLIEALEEKKIAYAALDVMWDEPAPKNHPFLKMPNVLLTPHYAGVSIDAKKWTSRMVTEDLINYATGKPLQRVWTRLK